MFGFNEKPKTKNPPKIVYVLKRTDGGFNMNEMCFTLETALKRARRWRNFYDEDITPDNPSRTWEREHYLVECEIVEKNIINDF